MVSVCCQTARRNSPAFQMRGALEKTASRPTTVTTTKPGSTPSINPERPASLTRKRRVQGRVDADQATVHSRCVELPDADYSRDSYVVLLLPEDGAPTVFQQGNRIHSPRAQTRRTCGRTPPPVSTHRPQYRWIPVRRLHRRSLPHLQMGRWRSIRVVTASRRSQRCTSEKLREPRCQRKRCFRRVLGLD